MRHLRNLLYFVVGLLLGAVFTFAHAASYTSGGTKNWGPGYKWQGNGTISGGSAQTIESINVGGKYISVPFAGPIAAAALETIINGLKSSPKTIAGPIAAAWLIGKGIEYYNDNWRTKDPSQPPVSDGACWQDPYTANGDTPKCSPSEWHADWSSGNPSLSWTAPVISPDGLSIKTCAVGQSWVCKTSPKVSQGNPTCQSGYTWDPALQTCDAPWRDVGQADWDKALGILPPDQVLEDLCKRLAKYGTPCGANGVLGQQTTVPLSDYAPDPVTGVQSRQVATLTPAGTSDDPTRMEVKVNKQEKTTTTDPGTGQTTTTETTKKNDEPTDFCVLHPNSLACMEGGEPEDVDLQKDTRNFQITPQTGFGADNGTCPPDRVLTLRTGGIQISESWQPVCQMATTFRPAIIGMAWILATMIGLGLARRAE